MAVPEFFSDLDLLLNPTHDLGGGPSGDPRAIAQLLAGGAKIGFNQPTSSLQKVMDSASAIADTLQPDYLKRLKQGEAPAQGEPVQVADASRKTLVANPFGPGSYDPADPEAVAAIQKQAQRKQAIDQARQFIGQIQGDPSLGAARGGLVQNILQSVGLGGETTFEKAFQEARGKALGEQVVGGKTIPNEVMGALGKEDFDEQLTKAVADNKITAQQQIQLTNIHDRKVKQNTVGDIDRRTLTSLRGSFDHLDQISKAYEKTTAAKSGKMSDALSQAITLSEFGASVAEFTPVLNKLTPEDREFVALYNAFRMSLRRVSEDSRFSNFDAQQVIRAIGNPIVGPDLYRKQVQAAKDVIRGRANNLFDDLRAQGKNLKYFKPIGETTATGAVGAPRIMGIKKISE